jgi:hypothetical protein
MKVRTLVAIACLLALPLTAAKTTTKTKVYNDATRLAAILSDAQNDRMNFSADAWKVTANEANTLANRIYAQTGGRSQAKDLRTHVRQMRDAALKGDGAGARQHAGEAAPFAYQLIDWSAPAQPAK